MVTTSSSELELAEQPIKKMNNVAELLLEATRTREIYTS